MERKKNKKLFSLESRRELISRDKVSEQHQSRYLLAHFQKLENVKRDLKRLPEVGEFFFLQSDKSFNAMTFIAFISEKESIKHLKASTYSLSRKAIDALVHLHETGFIDMITFLINDGMIKRVPGTVDYLRAIAQGNGNIKVKFAWVHAKVTLMETRDHYYVLEGSGNLSDNACYEQYTLANDKDLFRFRESLFNDIQIRHEFD
jgi:hypothetical protein